MDAGSDAVINGIADCRLRIVDCGLRVADCGLRIVDADMGPGERTGGEVERQDDRTRQPTADKRDKRTQDTTLDGRIYRPWDSSSAYRPWGTLKPS